MEVNETYVRDCITCGHKDVLGEVVVTYSEEVEELIDDILIVSLDETYSDENNEEDITLGDSETTSNYLVNYTIEAIVDDAKETIYMILNKDEQELIYADNKSRYNNLV